MRERQTDRQTDRQRQRDRWEGRKKERGGSEAVGVKEEPQFGCGSVATRLTLKWFV